MGREFHSGMKACADSADWTTPGRRTTSTVPFRQKLCKKCVIAIIYVPIFFLI